MATTWRTGTQGNNGSANTVTVTEPGSAALDDYQVLVVTAPAAATVNTPAGWAATNTQTGTNAKIITFTRTRGAGAGTLTVTGTFGGSTLEWTFASVNVGSTPVVDTSAFQTVAQLTTPDPPSATATGDIDEAIAIGVNWFGANAGGATVPGGYTARTPAAQFQDCRIASKTLAAAGAENPGTFTNYGGSDTGLGGTILLLLSTATKSPPFDSRARGMAPLLAQ